MSQRQSTTPVSVEATAPPENVALSWFRTLGRWAILRIAIYLAAVIGALILSKLATMPFIPPAPSPLHGPLTLAANLGSAALLLGAYALVVRLVERRAAREIDPRSGVGLFLIGTLLGAGLMATVFLILWGLGMATFPPGTGVHGLIGLLAVAFAVGVMEELILRAIVFRVLEDATGTTVAVIFSAILFGLLHAINPGATLLSSAAIALEGGVMLALAFVLTRSLWCSIGIHMSWNFTQGAVFGAQVSGFAPSHSLLRTVLTGPEILTGGAFGPEASIVSMVVCSLASVVLGVLVIRRAGWRPRTLKLRLA
ncbi:MAG TPA: type II CAAX endopeptidase family protein [Caulobacteraceae bacterium]